jgi:cytochrome c-type biogenesis protein CcmH/NrfF
MLRTLPILLLLGAPIPLAPQADVQVAEGVEGMYEPHPEARKAISRLLSPYCPGLMLERCPVPASRMLRDSIHAMALQGARAHEIEGWMLANHGEEHRAVPLRSGIGLLAWAVPPAALLAGLVGLIALLRSSLRLPGEDAATDPGADPRPAAAGSLSPEDERRLREAIRELELSDARSR